MKTKVALDDFIACLNSSLVVKERDKSFNDNMRFYVYSPSLEILEGENGNILSSPSGNGKTIKKAKSDYAAKLSGQRITLNGFEKFRYLKVPILY